MTKDEKTKQFINLVRSERITLYNYVKTRFFKCSEDAEDVLQSGLARAYENIDKYKPGNMRAWLYKIVIRECLNEIRKEKAPRTISNNEKIDYEECSYYLREGIDIEKEYESNDEFMYCFNQLREREKSILTLWAIGMSTDEIAEIEDIPKGTVMSGKFRAREKLWKKLRAIRV